MHLACCALSSHPLHLLKPLLHPPPLLHRLRLLKWWIRTMTRMTNQHLRLLRRNRNRVKSSCRLRWPRRCAVACACSRRSSPRSESSICTRLPLSPSPSASILSRVPSFPHEFLKRRGAFRGEQPFALQQQAELQPGVTLSKKKRRALAAQRAKFSYSAFAHALLGDFSGADQVISMTLLLIMTLLTRRFVAS